MLSDRENNGYVLGQYGGIIRILEASTETLATLLLDRKMEGVFVEEERRELTVDIDIDIDIDGGQLTPTHEDQN